MSHSPLLLSVTPRDRRLGEGFFAAIDVARRAIESFRPELVVIFAPDHFNGFFYGIMPPFCVGTAARSGADWDIEPGTLRVPKPMAERLCTAVREAGVDLAISHRMAVDHGATIPLRMLFGRLDACDTIPIFVNCAAPPLPSCGRVRKLGEAVGRFLVTTRLRTLIIGSGGLSHDPPHPGFEAAPPDAREYLLGAQLWTIAIERKRQERVRRGADQLIQGGGPCLPPNRAWDRNVLDRLLMGDLVAFDSFADEWISREGGSGGHEIRNWIAAFAALGAGGTYEAEELFYAIITDWITGMAVVHGTAAVAAPSGTSLSGL
ncbi:MAG TPA: 3-carboxyethylcatechol 2,3-dioxygenase [Candidatus Binataceae bacterium]|nr:3-carboxyethylcatechol 2,3-dioxygenase [Candidatus Binataceae bacterium]